MSKSAQQRHPRNLIPKSYLTWFDISIKLIDRRATTCEIAGWLHGRATQWQIKNWRRGLAKPPQWVIDRLGEMLRQQASRALQAAAIGEAGPGSNGTIALHNYRRQRALEREKGTV